MRPLERHLEVGGGTFSRGHVEELNVPGMRGANIDAGLSRDCRDSSYTSGGRPAHHSRFNQQCDPERLLKRSHYSILPLRGLQVGYILDITF